MKSRWPYRLYDLLTFKSAVKGANVIVVSSRLEEQDALRFGVPQNRIRVIPMGIDLPAQELKKEENLPVRLLFVGRIARVRRVELILKAVSNLPFDWTLTLVGGEAKTSSMTREGYLQELKNLVKELGIENRVEWVGPIAPELLSALYQKADLFLYTSQYENFGQPLLEAAAHGVPLISTRVGIANELIEEWRTGFFTEGTPECLAEKITLLKDPHTRREYGDALRSRVSQDFSWDRVMEQYLQVYRDLCGAGGL